MDDERGTVLEEGEEEPLDVVVGVHQTRGSELANTEAVADPTVPSPFSYDQTLRDMPLEWPFRKSTDSSQDCDRACPSCPSGGLAVVAGIRTVVEEAAHAAPLIPSSRIVPMKACDQEGMQCRVVAAGEGLKNCCDFLSVIPDETVGTVEVAGDDGGDSSPGFPRARNSFRTLRQCCAQGPATRSHRESHVPSDLNIRRRDCDPVVQFPVDWVPFWYQRQSA
jgi:hypothetical protein